jgi:hypothetical protein
MCSTSAQRIAEIGQAIDDLAEQATTAYSRADRADRTRQAATGGDEGDQVVIRLAQLWALLAELDPEVARRLPIYTSAGDETDEACELRRARGSGLVTRCLGWGGDPCRRLTRFPAVRPDSPRRPELPLRAWR